MKRTLVTVAAVAALASACAPDDGGKGYTEEDLARYKTALPARSTLTMRNVPSGTAAAFGGTPTLYPSFAVPIAMQINGMVGGTMDIIEFVASLEPTLYDSEDLEFWWGPIPDAESPLEGDHVSLYIHDQINDADFNPQSDLRYEFAIIRGLGNDVASLTPILYGAATPVEANPDYGLGVFIYDFDNNVEFEDAYNPTHGPLTEGRFATIFAKGPDETNPSTIVTFVIAAFRDFLPEDAEAGATAANVDYFWGNFADAANSFDFLDFEFAADVIDDTTAAEDLRMKLAFFNSSVGRAEVSVTNGDLNTNTASAVECWDATVSQTYLAYSLDTGMGPVLQGEEGVSTNCVWDTAQFDQVPDLSDVAGMKQLVDDIATFGIPSDIPEENG